MTPDISELRIYPNAERNFHKPLVSVIIPAYNRYNMLCEAVGSVLCQTFKDFELIVVDDGSTDRTARVGDNGLNAMRGAQDSPAVAPGSFSFLRLEHTGMPGAGRNRGAEAARGRYIAFLDSDDLWMPRKLELQVALMEEDSKYRISHTRELWLRNGKTISQTSQKHTRCGRLFNDSLVKCIIGPSTVMMERALFLENNGFREDLEIAEDYELWLKITSNNPVGYIDQPLTIKRAGHGDQLTSKYGYIEHFRIKALKELLDRDFFSMKERQEAIDELVRKCAIYADGAKKRGKLEEASQYKSLAERFRKESMT
jgi:glycosyltransferase involved in cell wall biosynthesis